MQNALPKRSEVPVELTWNLGDIFEDVQQWEQEAGKALEISDQIAAYEGKLTQDAGTLLQVMRLYVQCLNS